MKQQIVTLSAEVVITVADNAPEDWISRVSRDDFPYWNHDGSRFTEEQGIEMLAYNASANGVRDANRLDGWGDLEPGMVSMSVTDVFDYDIGVRSTVGGEPA